MVVFYLYSICPILMCRPKKKLGDSGISVHPTYPEDLGFGLPAIPDSHARKNVAFPPPLRKMDIEHDANAVMSLLTALEVNNSLVLSELTFSVAWHTFFSRVPPHHIPPCWEPTQYPQGIQPSDSHIDRDPVLGRSQTLR